MIPRHPLLLRLCPLLLLEERALLLPCRRRLLPQLRLELVYPRLPEKGKAKRLSRGRSRQGASGPWCGRWQYLARRQQLLGRHRVALRRFQRRLQHGFFLLQGRQLALYYVGVVTGWKERETESEHGGPTAHTRSRLAHL